MSLKKHILNDVGILSVSDKIGDVQELFNQLTYTHLPVESEGIYVGCISENDIRCFENDKTLDDYRYALEGFFMRESNYWLDSLEAFGQNNCNILPVLDDNNNYLGYVELNEMISLFKETPFLHEPGNILVIEKAFKDFTFGEVSQIVESNNAHLLGAFVSKMEDDMAEITVKVTPSGMNEIIQAFRRYGYLIISEHQEDTFNKNLKDRSQYLDKYLNI
ncbi:CBS domain-containing protein [Christiangramia gaetbulicola]|uniref:CBS domain-containing protein n=1 Tax=Christiangramia gaetbulicola TaxID=703340 RepID=A0A2T6AKS2_9FLAO|nr:CBS domain-containing protein [Christiangramia gaetbulicola]PTX44412.1 CBS domain-containing protein [Christiangramia gaetbulicola]